MASHSFQKALERLNFQARENARAHRDGLTQLEQDEKAGRFMPDFLTEQRKAGEKAYREKREDLRREHAALLESERLRILRDAGKAPLRTSESEWREIIATVDRAQRGEGPDDLGALIRRAALSSDAGLARGIGAALYARIVDGREANLHELGPLYEVDPAGVGDMLDFEADHGNLRPREAKLLGPLGGQD